MSQIQVQGAIYDTDDLSILYSFLNCDCDCLGDFLMRLGSSEYLVLDQQYFEYLMRLPIRLFAV